MSDEADSGGSSPEPETPKEQVSEIQVTLGEHSKFVADNFDKLYDEIELLKVIIWLILVSMESILHFVQPKEGATLNQHYIELHAGFGIELQIQSLYSACPLHHVRYRQNPSPHRFELWSKIN